VSLGRGEEQEVAVIYERLWSMLATSRTRSVVGSHPSFLPYYSRGNLQDAMTQASVTGNKMPERRLLELFHGTCLA
jgi:hypothetical protein